MRKSYNNRRRSGTKGIRHPAASTGDSKQRKIRMNTKEVARMVSRAWNQLSKIEQESRRNEILAKQQQQQQQQQQQLMNDDEGNTDVLLSTATKENLLLSHALLRHQRTPLSPPPPPPRPISAFILFSNAKRASIIAAAKTTATTATATTTNTSSSGTINSSVSNRETLRRLAQLWKTAPTDEKDIYINQQLHALLEYKIAMIAYNKKYSNNVEH